MQRWPPTSNCTSVRRVEVHKWSILSHEINVDQRQLLHNMGYVMVCSNPDFECSWMKVKQLLREIYRACKYFLVSEVPRILHCHLSPRQMCVAASCCGCVSSQSVQKGDGPEAHSWEKIMSAPFLGIAESFSPLSLHLTPLYSTFFYFCCACLLPHGSHADCALGPKQLLLCSGVGLHWSGASV